MLAAVATKQGQCVCVSSLGWKQTCGGVCCDSGFVGLQGGEVDWCSARVFRRAHQDELPPVGNPAFIKWVVVRTPAVPPEIVQRALHATNFAPRVRQNWPPKSEQNLVDKWFKMAE